MRPMYWNLRRVRETNSPSEGYPPARFVHVYEVFYDEQNRPCAYSHAKLIDKIRFIRDWLRAPVLRWPDDFNGEPGFLKGLL